METGAEKVLRWMNKFYAQNGTPNFGEIVAQLEMAIEEEKQSLTQHDVSGSTLYPLAFLTKANKLFMKSETEFSAEGTPRYIPNPNASGTYSLNICMNDYSYTPIYDKKLLRHFM